ncbi:hypothetical protein BURPS1710b_0258 [Burkholderia pseudomallei 1710b]|uniref:Uncharacterized protein n=1 Tax=Burkholderia pseudomallei (strain 1710b) TaxID=320372 RepID=Q3JXN0_BURP1|nr:hypothetical protein BURPS1710b_0258 [Burkholderia pseudomallei 1710b]
MSRAVERRGAQEIGRARRKRRERPNRRAGRGARRAARPTRRPAAPRGGSEPRADAGRQLELIGRAVRGRDRIAAVQAHVVAGEVQLGALRQVVEHRAVQRFLEAVADARREAEVADVRVRHVAVAVVRGVVHAHLLIAELVVERALRRDLERHRPRVVLALAERALIAQVAEVAGVHAEDVERVVAADRERLVRVARVVHVAEEARHVERAAVVAERDLIGRVLPEARRIAERVARAREDAVAEQLLPREAVVVARARRTGRVEDHLLEVVRVRPAAFLGRELRRAVRVAVDRRRVARDRVLEARGELAERVVFDADPRIAVEDLARVLHVAVGYRVFAFEPEDHLRAAADVLRALQPPAAAAEPRLAAEPHADHVIALRVRVRAIGRNAQVDEPVELDARLRVRLRRRAGGRRDGKCQVLSFQDRPLRYRVDRHSFVVRSVGCADAARCASNGHAIVVGAILRGAFAPATRISG